MNFERLKSDGWLQALVLITVFSGGLWAFGNRAAREAEPAPATEAAPASAPAAVPAAASAKRPLNGKEWIVDADKAPGADFETLAEAVAAATAGDVIRLRRGLHRGSVVLDKALTVIGDGKVGETVLTGTGGFALAARRGATVTVENLSVSTSKDPDARAVDVRDKSTLRLVGGAYAGYDALAVAAVEEKSWLETDGTDFTGGKGSSLLVMGWARLKGGKFVGGKTLISVLGADASLEANGVALESGETGVGAGSNARVVLVNPRFARLKYEVASLTGSEVKLIGPSYDRANPVCLSQAGMGDCGTSKGP